MSEIPQKVFYSDEDRVFPSRSDDDLWSSVIALMQNDYPGRILVEHVREAFEAVCEENDDYMLFKDFLRKVRLKWLWKRPPAPRGMLSLE